MTIRRVNWGEITKSRPSWSPELWRVWAIWPSPVDHDLCFKAAGFDDFADTDEAWNSEFATFVGGMLGQLETAGRPKLASGEYPVDQGRVRQSLADALVAASRDDNFRPCTVTFGEPARALIRTSDGHPLLWIALAEGDAAKMVAAAAGNRDVREQNLDWEKLL